MGAPHDRSTVITSLERKPDLRRHCMGDIYKDQAVEEARTTKEARRGLEMVLAKAHAIRDVAIAEAAKARWAAHVEAFADMTKAAVQDAEEELKLTVTQPVVAPWVDIGVNPLEMVGESVISDNEE
ncbi:hypothetical protein ACLOJK_007462 [Asimina triloba]